MRKFGLDLKFLPAICHPARSTLAGSPDEPGQTGVRANHRALVAHDVPPMRGALRGAHKGQKLFFSQPISLHGVCSTDLPREFAPHRGASVRASFITWGSKLSGVIPIPSIEQRLDLRPDHRAHSR